MKLKDRLLFSLLLCPFLHTYSQYQENLPQAKPIPPNAVALFKPLEKPAGGYTGTIPVSFPLTTIKSGPLAVHLSLDYNSTGGIKVAEFGGPIGLGFNLNDGGGRITQMVRGRKPDDYGGILNGSSSIKPSNWNCDLEDEPAIFYDEVDLEPDIFMYSFGGRSGKFYISESSVIMLTKNDGIKIEHDNGYPIGQWTITDEQGTKYIFTYRMESQSSYSSNGGSGSTNISSVSWYLTYLEDITGQHQIWYTYTETGLTFSTFSGSYRVVGGLQGECDGFNTQPDEGSVTTDGIEYLVTRIDASEGYILVQSTAAYPFGPKRVTSIELYDPGDHLKKKYKFNYGTPFESNRQKLINFSECSISGTDSLTTKFEYIEDINLPSVYASGIDMWGYYNGVNNDNTGLIPNFRGWTLYGSYVNWTQYADRNAYWIDAKANLLKKILYPTGGYRELVYEGNYAIPDGDFFLCHPNPSFHNSFLVNRGFNETTFNNVAGPAPCMQRLFRINSATGNANFTYTLTTPSEECGAYVIKIMKLTDSTDLEGGEEIVSFMAAEQEDHVLVNGYYRIDVFVGEDGNEWNCTIAGLNGSWQESTAAPYPEEPYPVGGVRVKEVRDYDPVTNKIYKTQFQYRVYAFGKYIQGGVLITPVNMLKMQNNAGSGCEYQVLSPTSTYPLASEGGSYVVYPLVRTIDSAGGYTDREYSFMPDYPDNFFPYPPPVDMSYARGLLTRETVYDKNDTPLQQKLMGYVAKYGSVTQSGYVYKPYWYDDSNWWITENRLDYMEPISSACASYQVRGDMMVPTGIIESQFTPQGAIHDTIAYNYASHDGFYYRKSEQSSGSDGTTSLRTYKYAFNDNNEFRLGLNSNDLWIKAALADKHYYQPIEIVDSIKNPGGSYHFLQGAKYVFAKYLPDSVLHLKTYRAYLTATDSVETNYLAYDSSGNLREFNKINDTKQVVIWGYNRTYPVATVTGSDLSTVLGFISLGIINNPSSDAALRTELNKIRTGLAGGTAQVTTYTYSPLFGMTSATDPAGRTTYYEYDNFGRLRLVRDHNMYILKKYEYKMNNPQ